MSIEFDDDELRAVFADYRTSTGPRVRAAGAVAARSRALSRRRRRYGFLSAAAIVGLLAPAMALALSGGGTLIGGDMPAPVRTDAVPRGGLTTAQLMVSSMPMPVFEGDPTGTCPQGEVGLADDRLVLYRWPDTGQYLSYVDIDRDGSYETVLHLRCLAGGKAVAEQIVVVARGSGASLTVKGRVVGTGGDISAVGELSRRSDDGSIRVLVAGPRTCCERFYTAVEHQNRVYEWDGQGFKQTDGSTAFGQRPPADFELEAETRIASNAGIVRLTVTNNGTQPVDSAIVTLVAKGLRVTSPGWGMKAPGIDPATIEFTKTIAAPVPGASVTVELTLRLTSQDANSSGLTAMVVGIVGGDEAADATPHDNENFEVALTSG